MKFIRECLHNFMAAPSAIGGETERERERERERARERGGGSQPPPLSSTAPSLLHHLLSPPLSPPPSPPSLVPRVCVSFCVCACFFCFCFCFCSFLHSLLSLRSTRSRGALLPPPGGAGEDGGLRARAPAWTRPSRHGGCRLREHGWWSEEALT